MEIKQSKKGHVTIVEIIGHLDSHSAPDLEKQVFELIKSGIENFIFDLSQTEFVSSAGLSVFLATAKQMRGKMKIKFCNPNKVVLEVLEISGLLTILDVKRSLEVAIDELS